MPHHPTLRPAAARSVEELRMLVDAGATPRYLHFWGHRPEADGTVERFEIVVRGNEHKFAARPELRDYLLRTGSRVLVEASPRDRVWGIGMGARNENAEQPAAWRGLNLLGFALMEARERLRG